MEVYMREEFMNLWILENHEAEERIGCRIESREKLHHWPLSWVEKWTLVDGRTVVYKSQCAAASVEKTVYEQVRAPFLIPLLYAESCRGCDMLVFPYCRSSSAAIPFQAKTLANQCGELLQTVNDIPIFFDLSSADKMIAQTETACLALGGVRGPELSLLFNWMEAELPRLYTNQPVGIIHGDINLSNLIMEAGAVRYILDWQRPMLAPLALEQALAMRLAGCPSKAQSWDLLALTCHILWYAWAYTHVLPIKGVQEIVQKLMAEFSTNMEYSQEKTKEEQ